MTKWSVIIDDRPIHACTVPGLVHSDSLQIEPSALRLRSCPLEILEPPVPVDIAATTAPAPVSRSTTERYLDLETRAFWAAVTWDTSSSMMLNIRSTISSGLKGACLEPVWRLTRGFLVGSFHSRTAEWRGKTSFEVTKQAAGQIISAASICRIYTWRTIASGKEAIREGVDEDDLPLSWKALLDAVDIFNSTIRPLLNNCQRQLHFLNQVNRLTWYETMLHYYLGILVLTDALKSAKRSDLLSQVTESSMEAEYEIVNVLKVGLEAEYSIQRPHIQNSSTDSSLPPATVSFLAIDPYPHHAFSTTQKTAIETLQGRSRPVVGLHGVSKVWVLLAELILLFLW